MRRCIYPSIHSRCSFQDSPPKISGGRTMRDAGVVEEICIRQHHSRFVPGPKKVGELVCSNAATEAVYVPNSGVRASLYRRPQRTGIDNPIGTRISISVTQSDNVLSAALHRSVLTSCNLRCDLSCHVVGHAILSERTAPRTLNRTLDLGSGCA